MTLTSMRRAPARWPAWPGWYLLAALALLASLAAEQAWAQDTQAEYRIKAAFVCKFGNYIEWPPAAFASPEAPFSIGVWAPAAVADEVAAAAGGLLVHGRPISVRRVGPGDSLEGLHILFVARGPAARLAAALAAVKDRPILTVTESDMPAEAGAVVNFVIVDDKVKFDVSLAAAERSSLKVSARLLGVARQVAGGRPSS
ncbi:YfiR family protein [Ideonella sp.]|uniref:YfiR family protein n=1 Tax=Ideonella sp. TaxID=1929293 RepID=UPI002B470BEF|nr:YfiR family protein [Ideonella sp.]HJV68669.1 YfiR family protein [Ideonella sp.]